tara:strand:- start:310 stop:990 length:681 start_codon:yes stop_codon:yes gene_type:complete
MAVVCKKTDFVFKAQNIPKFLGHGPRHRTPEENTTHAINNYLIRGERLDPNYYKNLEELIKEYGEEIAIEMHKQDIWNKKLGNNESITIVEEDIYNPRHCMSGIRKLGNNEINSIVGQDIYEPGDCMSGIFKIMVTDDIGLVARVNGITRDGETVVILDEYWDRPKLPYGVEDEIKIKMLGTMAVWKAKKCIYILSKMNNQTITLDFDSEKWQDILTKLQEIDYGI